MSKPKFYKDLPEGQANWLIPTTVQAMITGCQRAIQTRDGAVTLHYDDGSTETAMPVPMLNIATSKFFAVVEAVQWARILTEAAK